MTYNVFSGTLNPTHFTSRLPFRCQLTQIVLEKRLLNEWLLLLFHIHVIACRWLLHMYSGNVLYWFLYCLSGWANYEFWLLFSIGNDFRFEKGIEEMLKCEVHAFDPRCDFFSCLIAFYEKIPFVFSIFISSPRRWPNTSTIWSRVRPSVRASTKSFSDFHVTWCVGRPWPHMHTSVTSTRSKV